MRLTDPHKNYNVRTVANLFLAVHSSKSNPPKEAQLACLVGDICMEVERRRLSYPRNMERYKFHGMPWLEAVLRRLPPLPAAQKLVQLTFISCIGLRMNGEFVDYVQLKELAQEMPLPQSTLQKRLIQSKD